MTIKRVYNHAIRPSPQSSYSFALTVAEYSFSRTTAAHPNYIQEKITNRLSSEKCLLSFISESVFDTYSNTCRCNFSCHIRVLVGLYEGRQIESNCCSRRGEGWERGADIMAGFTNCVHRLKLLANCIE